MTDGKRSFTRRGFVSSLAAGAALATSSGARSARPIPAKIRIGQIGVGHAHAAGKMQAYRESPDFEVVGVVEENAELRRRAEANPVYRGLRWLTREQLLGEPGLQAVAVETEVKELLAAAQAGADAGVHIHLDKPAGASLPAFRRVLETVSEKGRVVQMGYMYRYNPAVVMMRDLLGKGWLGEPFEVHTVMSKVVSASSRRALAGSPGGMMFELACHIIDLTVAVLGTPDKVTPFVRHSSSIADDLNDNMLAVLEYKRALASVKSSAQEVEGFARRHFVVCGTEGTFHIQPLDDPSARLALSRPRGEHSKGLQEITFPRYVRYVDDARDLARIIRGEKETDFSPAHDLAVQETVLRASGLPVGP